MISIAIKDTRIKAWGDSMVEATANSNPLDKRWPQMLSGQWPGVSVYNGGVGGETAEQIKARFLAYQEVNTSIIVIWAGRNGVLTSTAQDIVDTIQGMVDHVGDQRYIVLSVINKKDGTENAGSAGDIAISALNELMAATWPANYLNVRTPLDDVNTRGADQLHLNAAGNLIVRDMVRDFVNTKGWIEQFQ